MKNLLAVLLLFIYHATPRPDNVVSRFTIPAGFTQVRPAPDSFAGWLQALPLKPAGTHTLTYAGSVARTDPYTAAVVDISIGNQDLQQCADAVMRLRGEYLYNKKDYKDISFKFESGFNCNYLHYANGYRYHNGKWVLKGKPDYTYPTFMHYMALVFTYAGTLSLEKELKPVRDPNDIETGDVFIRGGSPGHCFIVMDVVENNAHKKQFLLAQSFLPAQNIQLLQDGKPWFSMNAYNELPYGDLVNIKYLRRF